MISPSGRQIRLAAHDQELVAVEVGGGLRTYRAAGREVLDGYGEDETCAGGRGQLLAPWPNRLAGGSFEWQGQQLQTALTEVGAGNAIHGLVRWANWTLPEAESLRSPYTPASPVEAVSVAYRLHPQPGWPWILDFRVTYRLTPDHGLEVRTTATNRSAVSCPVGFGWHPYLKGFVDTASLTLPGATAYRSDERGLPVERFAVEGTDLDFRSGRPIGPARLDVALTDLERGPDGRARARFQPLGGPPVTLWMDEGYTHLMVFTGDTLAEPARRRQGLAVEPMTGAPNLLNNHFGLRTLDPGETVEASWGVDPFSNS